MSSTSTSGPATLKKGDQLVFGDVVIQGGDPKPERRIVESFISAVLQSEHLNLLVGSGLTTALGSAARATSSADMTASLLTSDPALDSSIEKAASDTSKASMRGETPNIEDRLRVALAAEGGLKIVNDPRADLLEAATEEALTTLRDSVATIESAIGSAPAQHSDDGSPGPVPLLTSFLGSFAGRVPTRDRLHAFTTNYDRVLEWGAEQAGLRIVDRFVGALEPVFRSSRLEIDYHYTPPGSPKEPRHLDGVVRLTKLHGSLDWRWRGQSRQVVRQPVPFGAIQTGGVSDLLIYPNAAKDFETTLYPYADLFRDFSAAVCRPNATLVTYGYSFGDDHINRIIRDMLTIPSTHLLIISYGDDGNRVTKLVEEYRRTGQVSLMLGPTFADLNSLTQDWLPKPATATLARLQAGILTSTTPPSSTPPASSGGAHV
ncbi:SIR2 family protein [Rhodococcus sp. C3V]|uniref:SIR2 family protein n=1 Tax=Rhodococcus sp. C3V TaxID=3034165 RepID=UPI0023E31708|nr:SIR2 family protein [Rhodococcus sp. C3V]MDF3316406.1 SIR2 family protein [Rhodococcus sp. C3V]